MNPINQAAIFGYSANQILDFISKAFPGFVPKIQSAKKSGYNIQQILDFLSKSTNGESYNENMTQHQIHATQRIEKEEFTKNLLKTGATAAGSFVGGLALSRALPAAVQQIAPNLLNSAIAPSSNNQPEIQQPIVEEKLENKALDVEKLLSDMNMIQRIESLSEKLPPETVAKVVEQHFLTSNQKKYLKENVGKTGEELVNEFLKKRDLKTQPEKVQERLALFPDGKMGDIQSEKNGIAKINVDGQEKHRKLNEVIQSPIPKKDLAEIYEDLKNAIPEEARSSVINWAGYDANKNELAFRPHSGALYIYENIPQEFADKLQNSMFKAKTSGENFYGSWKEGGESRFAGLSQLIRELQKQYGGKGKEYIRKYETVHDFLALPEAAKREQAKKLKDEKRKKRKKA